MHATLARKPIVERVKRRCVNPREAAEALFKRNIRPANDTDHAVAATVMPRILEDVSKDSIEAAVEKLTTTGTAIVNPEETQHQKVFRLIAQKDFRGAALLAKKLIDAEDVEGFYIYRDTPKLRAAKGWFDEQVELAKQTEQAGWHKITPERAQVLIEANDGNRRINADGLEERLRDMHDGAWSKNGETVIVSKCRHLNDGQHRCWAALLLGIVFTTAMSWGVERDTRNFINTGVIRKGRDRLHFDGISDPANKAAVANLAHIIFLGRKPTKREEQEFYHEHEMLIERAYSVVKSTVRGGSIAAFRVAAMHLIQLGASDADMETFFSMVRKGDKSRDRGCPAFSLYKEIAVIRQKHPKNVWVASICDHFLCWKSGKQQGSFAAVSALPRRKVA